MDEATKAMFDIHDNRITKLENSMDALNDLALSVKEIAINTNHMADTLNKQGERLEKLETSPLDTYANIKRTVITTIVSVVAGALASGILMIIAKGI